MRGLSSHSQLSEVQGPFHAHHIRFYIEVWSTHNRPIALLSLQWEKVNSNSRKQWLSKCGPQTNSVTVIRELVRRASYRPLPSASESEPLGMGPAICFNAS